MNRIRMTAGVLALAVALSGCSLARWAGIGDGLFDGLVVIELPTIRDDGAIVVELQHRKTGLELLLICPPTSKHYRACRALTVLDSLGSGIIGDIQRGESSVGPNG